jgi:hypothetical protein
MRRAFPNASTADAPLLGPGAAVPGNGAGNTAAGYSWLVQLLDHVEELALYAEIKDVSDKFKTPPFRDEVQGAASRDLHAVKVALFFCPSFSGSQECGATIYPNAPAAVGNYVCLPATHLDSAGKGLVENGVIVSKRASPRGKGREDVLDGITKTFLATESREESMASWYDGQTTWVTALKTDVLPGAGDAFPAGPDGAPVVPDSAEGSTALNVEPYLDLPPLSGAKARRWGPSSMHLGGVVIHVYVDGHVQPIPDDIDPTVYMRLTTANGGEPVELPSVGD